MKQIKGKCDFWVVSAQIENIYGKPNHRCDVTPEDVVLVNEIRTIDNSFYLSTMTEKDCVCFVDEMEGVGFMRYTPDGQIEPASLNWKFGLTAKESLVSLLKANDCWIKEWKNIPEYEEYIGLPDPFNFIRDMDRYRAMPDDFLIIKIQ